MISTTSTPFTISAIYCLLLTAYRAMRPKPACPEPVEWVEGLTAYQRLCA
jgi:hypothetical protein